MYSAASQLLGRTLGISGMSELGRWWLVVALTAWLTVAAGEVRYAFRQPA
jgi:hypothetical protein